MIQVSSDWKNLIYANHTSLQVRAEVLLLSGRTLYLDYGDEGDGYYNYAFMSNDISFDDATSSESAFDIGQAVMNIFSFKLNNFDRAFSGIDFTDAVIAPYVGMKLSDGKVEWVKKGKYLVADDGLRGNVISLTAYDYMQKLEMPFSKVKITYPATIGSIAKSICDFCGVSLANNVFPNSTYQVKAAPAVNAYSCRQMIAYIAQIAGCFARFNSESELEIKWYEMANKRIPEKNYHEISIYKSLEIKQRDTTITGVKVSSFYNENSGVDSDEDPAIETVQAGADGFVIYIENNPLIPYGSALAVAETLESLIVGTTFRPLELTSFYDPSMEAGDTVEVTDSDGNTYDFFATNISVKIGSYAKIVCGAESTSENVANQYSESTQAIVAILEATNAKFKDLVTNHLEAAVGEFGFLKSDEAELTYATIERASILQADIENVAGNLATYKTVVADQLEVQDAKITNVTGDLANYKTVIAEQFSGQRADLDTVIARQANFENTTTENFTAVNAEIEKVSGDVADYKLVIANQFISYDSYIEDLRTKHAEIEEALIAKASVIDLEALRTRTGILEADYSELDTLVNGNLTSDNIQSLVISGEKFTIADGFIKNAMIESLAFDKITGFDINTTKLTVHSEDGKSTWTDNTIQISDENRVRVQIGEDASGDYNMYLWDASGNLLWNATGVTESGLNDGIIKDAAVAEDANISGSKLDIESVITEVNGATTKLKSTTILFNESGQTLDVAFNTMTTTITNNLAESKAYADSKSQTALADAKSYADSTASTMLTSAQQYALNQANTALANAKSYADSAADGIEIGGRNYLRNSLLASTSLYDGGECTFAYGAMGTFMLFSNVSLEPGNYVYSLYLKKSKGDSPARIRFYKNNSSIGYYAHSRTDGEWGIVRLPFTVSSATDIYGSQIYNHAFTDRYDPEVSVKRLKIERGNKATDWTPAPEDTEAEITNLTEITTTQSTQISTMQGQITALITEDTNIKGDYNALVSRYNATVADVDSMKTTIGEHTTLIDAANDDIIAVNARMTTVETDLTGIKTRVSATETAITKKADGTTVDALTSRVATAESTLEGFETSLTATNQTVSDNYTALNSKIDGIEIGGRNLIAQSLTVRGWVGGAGNVSEPTSTVYQASDYIEVTPGETLVFQLWNPGTQVWFDDTYFDANKQYIVGTYGNKYATTDHVIQIYTVPEGAAYIRMSYSFSTGYKVKLERGNKATDWTPAPEDVESEIATVSSGLTQAQKDILANAGLIAGNATSIQTHAETLSSHDTRITAAEEAITLKVSATEFNSYKTTVTGQISTAKSEAISTAASDATTKANNAKSAAISAAASDATTKANNALTSSKSYTDAKITVVNESLTTTNQEITVMKGQIELKVEQTDIDTAIANVEIGGRNLFLNTGVEQSNNDYRISQYKPADEPLVAGEVYTATICVTPAPNVTRYVLYFSGGYVALTTFEVSGTSKQIISKTFTMKYYSGKEPSVSMDFAYAQFYRFPNDGTVTSKSTVHWVKIEKGTKATDWTPAPEDVDASITAVDNKFASYSTTTQMNSAIKAAKDEINLSVSQIYATVDNVSGIESRLSTAEGSITAHANAIALCVKESDVTGNYLIGKINLSSTTATIAAKHINLAGAVTISMLASDTKTQLDTASGNASTALTNAANAQSTANTAVSNAATAQSTANTANSRATYHYGTCETTAATAAKVGTMSGFVLYTGAKISIKFTYTNTVANPTLNVNSTGAKTIRANGANLTAASKYNWRAGSLVNFVYDGNYWVMEESTANYLWSSSSDVTKIDGGYIQTGTVDAAVLKAGTTISNVIYATNLHVSGSSTFSGELNGATGTFSGALAAATGTFKGIVYASGIEFNDNVDYLKSDNNIWLACGGARADNDMYMDYNVVTALGATYAGIVKRDGLRIQGNVISSDNDVNFLAQHTSNGTAVGFGVGSGGTNRGIYDYGQGAADTAYNGWMLYKGSNDNYTYIPSTYLSLGGRGNYIGYVINASKTSVSTVSGTIKAVTSLSLPAGAWLVIGNVYFPATTISSKAYAMINLSTTSADEAHTGFYSRFVTMSDRVWCNIEVTRVFSISASARTVYLNARHDSGSSIAVNGYIYAIKIA